MHIRDIFKLIDGIYYDPKTGISYVIGPINVPDNIYVEITSTVTKGTIGKLVDVSFLESTRTCGLTGKIITSILTYGTTLIIQVDGRKTTNRISVLHANILKDYTGQTIYKHVPKKKKTAIPLHINKFGQSIELGSWVVGTGFGKTLSFGEVVSWSASSIFVKNNPDDKQAKHVCLNNPKQTLVLPGQSDEYKHMVTLMALTGYLK